VKIEVKSLLDGISKYETVGARYAIRILVRHPAREAGWCMAPKLGHVTILFLLHLQQAKSTTWSLSDRRFPLKKFSSNKPPPRMADLTAINNSITQFY